MGLTMEDLMPRVRKGVAWLDGQKADWFNVIDLSVLDLSDCAKCALGQCFGGYSRGLVSVYPEYEPGTSNEANPATQWASAHGFERSLPFALDGAREFELLRECWVTVILERRFQQQSTVAEASVLPDAVDVLVESR